MLLNPIVGYLGTRVNGPKLIGFGCILVAFSSIFSGMPYFFYGTSDILVASSTSSPQTSSFPSILTGLNGSDLSGISKAKFEFCDGKPDDCINRPNSFNKGAFLMLAGASFLNGVGYTSFWTIGLPYLDDNTKKGNSPIYISNYI